MRVHYERCCGIDVHNRSVTACLLWGPAGQEPQSEVRRFGTMTADLRQLAAWLTTAGWARGHKSSTSPLVSPVFRSLPTTEVLPHGIWRLLGPTGGYLLSYPAAAAVTGYLAEHGFDRRYVTQVTAMVAGLLVLFAGGVARLTYGPPAPLGFQAALHADSPTGCRLNLTMPSSGVTAIRW